MIEIKDFVLEQKLSDETIKEYENKVPQEMLEFWKSYGLGIFRDGYLRSINPNEWKDVLEDASVRYKGGVPLFVTAMGDLLVWCDGYVELLNFRHHTVNVHSSTMEFFFSDLKEEFTMNHDYQWQPYIEATEKYGSVVYDECFGYVPLLALGGSEKVENLQKLKVREHILLNVAMTGPIY